jgi:O-antigen/teichoic acid export membrane protein
MARAGAAATGPAPLLPGGTTNNPLQRVRTGKGGRKGTYTLLLGDSVIYGAGRALQKFLTALMLPLFTAFMSRSDYGIIGMVVTITTMLDVFVTLGFDVAFTRFYFDKKDPANRAKVVTHVFYVDFVYPGVLLGVLLVFMPQIAQLVMGGPGYALYFDIGVVTLFFTNLSDLPFTLMRLEHRPWTFTSFTIARVFIQVPLALVLLAVFHLGPTGYLLANLITVVILNIAAIPFYVPRLIRVWDWPLMRSMLDFAIPALFTAMSFYLLKLSDRFFLLHYQGKAEVGLYTVANSLSQPLYIVGMAFRMAWPQWHYAYLHDEVAHKRMIARSATYFMAFNGLFLAMIGLYLPLVVHLLLNHKFWSVGPTTFVLTLSVALYNLYFIFWVGANVAKKNRMIPFITLVAGAVNVGLNALLVPKYGMWAAAWTTTLGFGILAVSVYFVSNRWYPIRYEWRRLIVISTGAALTLAGGWAIAKATGMQVSMPFRELLVRELLLTPALLLYPLTLWLARFFTPSESRKLRAALRRVTGRPAARPAVATAGGAAAIAGPATVAGGERIDAADGDAASESAGDSAVGDGVEPDDAEYRRFAEETESEMRAEDMLDLAEEGDSTV